MFLFDTNAVSDAMNDHPKLVAKVAATPRQIHTSVIVQGEIHFGIERLPSGNRKTLLTQKASLVLAALPAEPITEAIAVEYASIRVQAEAVGLYLDDNDLWVAATALHLQAVLITRDMDFGRVPGLQVEDWTT